MWWYFIIYTHTHIKVRVCILFSLALGYVDDVTDAWMKVVSLLMGDKLL